ncbi:hypothetical protein M407DRAFT_27784 [Tulasnella calospora MUT 4182]|uniref:Conserved oligomeric Golgi complex subunit 5 N-terminal domain-containing protein n=1 Tax=Tulasnella calospora MUT 4182 TaxID=1051891 RepID=A0A0C3QBS6_9AGAM|nr:hypothetical protein M407DRAFT_27784 [Tulasnella calospora MUT 4182]
MPPTDALNDYSVFSNPDFDANEYANAVLAGEPYPPPPKSKSRGTTTNATIASEAAKEDISVALGKLTLGIDDVSQQLRSLVTQHHEALLSEAASVHQLEGSLQSVRQGLSELGVSLEKLRLKIRVPYQNLSAHVIRIQRLQLAADVLRRTSRFVLVARRLDFQMNELAKSTSAPPQTNGKPESNKAPSKASAALEENIIEGERERTVAKAALSIAELSEL